MLAKALVVSNPGSPFVLEDIEIDDEIRDDEVVVQMKATGVCHTDLNFQHEKSIRNMFPAVLGHEGAGVVVKIGAKVSKVQLGDKVAISYASCSTCKQCQKNSTSFCRDWERHNFGMSRSDGTKAYSRGGNPVTSHFFGQSSFSSSSIVMESCLIKIPDGVPFEMAAPLGCGLMTGAGAMLNVMKFDASSTVVINGVGAVGFAALMAVKLCPIKPERVICIDILEHRLKMAKEYGATHVINPKESPSLTSALEAITGVPFGVDASVDTTGRAEIVTELISCAAPKGIVVSVGVGKLTAEISANIFTMVNKGRSYVGCIMGNCFPQEFIPMLIEKWQAGQFPFSDLIKTYKATDMETAAHDVHSGNTVKAVLLWD